MSDIPAAGEQDLSHYVEVLLRRRWIVVSTAVLVFAAAAGYTYTRRPVYQAGALLDIEKERGGASGGGEAQNATLVQNSDDDYYETQYKLLQSKTLLRRVFAELDLGKTADFPDPGALEGAVSVAPVLRSRLVYVQVESHDPELAARAANRLSEDFVAENLSNQLFISKEVLKALQLNDGHADYDSLPAVVNSPLIQTLKSEYAKEQSQYAELSQRYTDKYPTLIQVKSNMASLEKQIKTETGRVVAALKTSLSGQLQGNNVRIIDPADVPSGPIRPRKFLYLALGLVGGIGAGTALALFVETIDQGVRTQADVEALDLPYLGVIPYARVREGERPYAPLLAPKMSPASEAFRNLRTALDVAAEGGKASLVLVTSSVQGEGKTYVAAGLAVAFAQLGESVLLVDGDLRQPQVHRAFAVPSKDGLADFLAHGKKAAELEAAVRKTEVPGLKLLTCGKRPASPADLLNTPRLELALNWACENYDRVIVDCTPMYPINDALLWGRRAKAALFVARFGATSAPLVRDAARKLAPAGIKLLGVVVNAARPNGLAYSDYGHDYQQYHRADEDPAVEAG